MKRYLRSTTESVSNSSLRDIAQDPNTPPETLAKLADSDDSWVVFEVARNLNTTPETLVKLANADPFADNFKGCQVAENPNTPPEALVTLADNWNINVRYAVARNPNTPPEALAKLADDDSSGVRKLVEEHPNTTPQILAKLPKSTSKSKSKSMIAKIKSLDWDDISYDEMFDIEADYLDGLEDDALDEMGLWIEPSIEGNHGGVWIYTKENDDTVVDGYDYGSYVHSVIGLALDSNDDEDFKNSYKDFISSIMQQDITTL